MLLLLAALAWGQTTTVEVEAGRLAAVGEELAGARVERVEQHAEFDRMHLRLPDGEALIVELALYRGGNPACRRDDLAIFPRFDLAGSRPAAAAGPVGELCARLLASAAPIGIRDARTAAVDAEGRTRGDRAPLPVEAVGATGGGQLHVPIPGPPRLRPVQALLIGLLLLAPALPWRRGGLPARDGAAIFALAVLARALLSPVGPAIAPDAAYESIVTAWGIYDGNARYGDGLGGLHQPLQALTGYDPRAIFGLHALLSALCAPLLWRIGAALGLGRAPAAFAGLAGALLPVALRLAASEVAHNALAFFELLAVWAALEARGAGARPSRPVEGLLPALAAALAAGFAVQLRPEALPFALLPAGVLTLATRRRPAALPGLLLLIALVAWRAAPLWPLPEGGPLRGQSWLEVGFWIDLLRPHLGPLATRASTHQVVLDLRMTPVVLPVFALIGVARALRPATAARPVAPERGPAILLLSWWGLSFLPIATKSYPLVDAWRLQLPAQAPLLLLAALGLPRAARWRRLALASPLLLLPLHLRPVVERWAGMDEWAALQAALPTLPPGARVLYADHEKHAVPLAQVGALLVQRAGGRAWWLPMSAFAEAPEPGPDLYAWEGLSCRIPYLPGLRQDNDAAVNPCARLRERCTLTPILVRRVAARADLDIEIPPGAEVGLYRVDGCAGN